jgi:hypothetical protein
VQVEIQVVVDQFSAGQVPFAVCFSGDGQKLPEWNGKQAGS